MKGAGMKLVYIASPLRGENPSGKDYKKNIEQAAKYCENACSLGVLAFAPHLYFTQFYNDTIPEQREKGLEMGLAMLEKCEELWVMGTHISQGMRGEIAHAKSLGIPIYNVEMPDDIMYYPVSADNHALLGQHSCMPDSRDKDYIGVFKEKCTPLMKKEYSEFAVPCIPNATIIPKDKSGLILDRKMVMDEDGNVSLSSEKEDIMKMWLESLTTS